MRKKRDDLNVTHSKSCDSVPAPLFGGVVVVLPTIERGVGSVSRDVRTHVVPSSWVSQRASDAAPRSERMMMSWSHGSNAVRRRRCSPLGHRVRVWPSSLMRTTHTHAARSSRNQPPHMVLSPLIRQRERERERERLRFSPLHREASREARLTAGCPPRRAAGPALISIRHREERVGGSRLWGSRRSAAKRVSRRCPPTRAAAGRAHRGRARAARDARAARRRAVRDVPLRGEAVSLIDGSIDRSLDASPRSGRRVEEWARACVSSRPATRWTDARGDPPRGGIYRAAPPPQRSGARRRASVAREARR